MAPQAAIAADTPQMETAVDSMTASSSSTRNFFASQNEAYHTATTTPIACRMPSAPACSTSPKRMVAPMITRPVLMNSSDRAAARMEAVTAPRWLTSRPSASAKITYSMPHAADAV